MILFICHPGLSGPIKKSFSLSVASLRLIAAHQFLMYFSKMYLSEPFKDRSDVVVKSAILLIFPGAGSRKSV